MKFEECHQFIDRSQFVEADNIASNIFKEIKILENYITNGPKILDKIKTVMLPKFIKLKALAENFTAEEFKVMKISFSEHYEKHYEQIQNIIDEVNLFKIDDFDSQLKEIDYYLNNNIKRLEFELENKNYIITNLELQSVNISKVENTAKNFISIFKIVQGSYSITDKEIKSIEQMLVNIDSIKIRLASLTKQFGMHQISYDELKEELQKTTHEITLLSKDLDHNLVMIDEIYKDEKTAREQISIMTEKINGTKKYIKYANFDDQKIYLHQIKNLNLELTQLYMLLSSFPIDIVKLNESLKLIINKVEKTTQDAYPYLKTR